MSHPRTAQIFVADDEQPDGNITVADFANDECVPMLCREEALWEVVNFLQNNDGPKRKKSIEAAIAQCAKGGRTADLATAHWLQENRHRS